MFLNEKLICCWWRNWKIYICVGGIWYLQQHKGVIGMVFLKSTIRCSRRERNVFLVIICLLSWGYTSLSRLCCLQQGSFHFNDFFLFLYSFMFSILPLLLSLAWHHWCRSLHVAAQKISPSQRLTGEISNADLQIPLSSNQIVTLVGESLHFLTS